MKAGDMVVYVWPMRAMASDAGFDRGSVMSVCIIGHYSYATINWGREHRLVPQEFLEVICFDQDEQPGVGLTEIALQAS